MYAVTNRQIVMEQSGLKIFGDIPNSAGPNELRLLRVEPRGRGWDVEMLADELDDASKRRLKLDPQQTHAGEPTCCARRRAACPLAPCAVFRSWVQQRHGVGDHPRTSP
jgi:hypothetical protein